MTKDRKPSKKFYEPRDNERVPESKVIKRDERKSDRSGSGKPSFRDEPFKRRNDDNRGERKSGFNKEGKPFEKSFNKDRSERGERRDKPSFGDRDRKRDDKPFEKSFNKDRGERGERRDKPSFGDRDRKRDDKPFEKFFSKDRSERGERRDKPSFGDRDRKRDDKPFKKSFSKDRSERGERRDKPSFGDRDRKREGKPYKEKSPFGNRENPFKDREKKRTENADKDYGDRTVKNVNPFRNKEIKKDKFERTPGRDSKGRFVKKEQTGTAEVSRTKDRFYEELGLKSKGKRTSKPDKEIKDKSDDPRLNRFIANAGVCSRRDADELIKAGKIEVNGVVVTEMGVKIGPRDVVKYAGKRLYNHKPVYIVMNKPKDCICTAEDPEGRRTVLDILEGEVEERVFPVGRLDRNTTGVLIITNDGELTQKLTHPSSELTKVYAATLDKDLDPEHLEQLKSGIELEDGPMAADDIAYTDAGDKKHIGIEIHSGRNRIIHRMFEHLGYRVDRLDRVLFAGMDKRGLKRGEWRYLKEKEITTLKRIKGN